MNTTDHAADLMVSDIERQTLLAENSRLTRCADFGEGVLCDLAEILRNGEAPDWAERLDASVEIMRTVRAGLTPTTELMSRAIGRPLRAAAGE